MTQKFFANNPVRELHSLLEAITRGDHHTSAALFARLRSMSLSGKARKLVLRLEALASTRSGNTPSRLSTFTCRRSFAGSKSIVTACMNRNENLARSLPSWLALDVNEIVVVDWGSSIPVRTTLASIQDNRVTIIEVPAATWCLTAAFNVGLQFASGERIYKVDADIAFDKNFLLKNPFARSEFVRGHWRGARDAGLAGQRFVNGTFGAFRADLISIGFYNEKITTYGWDDTDLYQRLTGLGRCARPIPLESIYHEEHDDDARLGSQRATSTLLFDRIPATEFHNKKNEELVNLSPGWRLNQAVDYEILFRMPNLVEAYPISNKVEVAVEQVVQAEQRAYFYFHKQLGEGNLDSAALKTATEAYTGTIAESDRSINGADSVKFWSLDMIALAASEGDRYFSPQAEIDLVVECLGITFEVRAQQASKTGLVARGAPATLQHSRNKKVLVTSLFEESNLVRRQEYKRCLKANLNYFDHVIVLLESESGALLNEVLESMPPPCRARLLTVPVAQRPTFDFLFKVANSLAAGHLVAVANADILFNDSFDRLLDVELDRSMVVLSRREHDAGLGEGLDRLIRSSVPSIEMAPNTWSADCWAFRAPLPITFDAPFEIGTFNCDSYLNKTLYDASFNIFNPCLSVAIDHIHSPEHNSSAHKKEAHAIAIAASFQKQKSITCDGVPLSGVQWCYTTDIVSKPELGRKAIFWPINWISITVDSESRLASTILLVFLLRHYADKNCWNTGVVLEYEQSGSQSLYLTLLTLSCFRLPNGIILSPKSDAKSRSNIEVSHANLEQAIFQLQGKADREGTFSLDDFIFELRRGSAGWSYGSGPDSEMLPFSGLCVSDSGLTLALLMRELPDSSLSGVNEMLQMVRLQQGLSPILSDLARTICERQRLRLPNIVVPSIPQITVVTSTYCSAEFFDGYLKNIAPALDEINGVAHIVDASSPENEQAIFEDFIVANPGLKDRFTYTRLDNDPGLYACWELGIQKSETTYISNANTDDRRSPFHLAALLKLLTDRPDLAAACTALRATPDKNRKWSDKTNDRVWFADLDLDTFGFGDLYLTGPSGQIMSRNLLHCMPVWRKDLHLKYGYSNEQKYGTSADWAFWLTCAAAGEKFGLLQEVLGMYWINPNSHNRRHDADGALELRIIKEFFGVDQQTLAHQ